MRRSFYQLYASLTSRSTSGASFNLAITNESCVGFHAMKGQNQDFGAGSAFDGSAPLFANAGRAIHNAPSIWIRDWFDAEKPIGAIFLAVRMNVNEFQAPAPKQCFRTRSALCCQ
jgi:hypothetical protein